MKAPRQRAAEDTAQTDGLFRPTTWDAEKRTIDVVLSAGSTVRWRNGWGEEWDEELIVGAGAVDLTRANNGAPFLLQHRGKDPDALLGAFVPGSVRVDGTEVVGTVQFVPEATATARNVESYIQEIALGFRANTSVGYRNLETQLIERSGSVPLVRVTRWEMLEGSSVNVPADNDAGFRARDTERTMPQRAPVTGSSAALTPEQRALEATRVDTIHQLASKRGLSLDHELVVTAIRTGQALDGDKGFRAALLELDVETSRGTAVSPHHRAEVVGDETTKIIDAMGTAICHRAAPHAFKLDNGAADFRYLRLADMGRQLLDRAGQSTRTLSDPDVAERMCAPGGQRAGGYHTSSDFAALMANVSSKMVLQAGREAPRTYEQVATRRSLPDFKSTKVIELSTLPDLDKVTVDAAEVKYTTFKDSGLDWRGYRYQSGFKAGPEAIVNDDQEVLAQWPMKATGASFRTRNGTFWTTILASTFGGVALFHADHRNLMSAGVAASAAGVDGLEKLAAAMVDSAGNLIDVGLDIILTGPHNKLALSQLFDRTNRNSDHTKNLPNGQDYTLVFERRLSGTAYYGLAPLGENGLLYGVVRGYEEPKVSVQTDFDTGGVKFKVEDSFAAVVAHYRGFFKNPGA